MGKHRAAPPVYVACAEEQQFYIRVKVMEPVLVTKNEETDLVVDGHIFLPEDGESWFSGKFVAPDQALCLGVFAVESPIHDCLLEPDGGFREYKLYLQDLRAKREVSLAVQRSGGDLMSLSTVSQVSEPPCGATSTPLFAFEAKTLNTGQACLSLARKYFPVN